LLWSITVRGRGGRTQRNSLFREVRLDVARQRTEKNEKKKEKRGGKRINSVILRGNENLGRE